MKHEPKRKRGAFDATDSQSPSLTLRVSTVPPRLRLTAALEIPVIAYAPILRVCSSLLLGAARAAAAVPEKVRFNQHVRPILSGNCFYCHGPDPKHREADLRLDLREGATADLGGYAAIVPGKPDESTLIKRVTSTDPDEHMPPPASKKPHLTDEQIAILRRWIEQGAEYEGHWAFLPLANGRAAGGEERSLDRQPHRPLHPRPPGARRHRTLARSRPRHAHPPRLARPHRPLAVAGGGRSVRCRLTPQSAIRTPQMLVDRLLASPALRRTLGPALARPGPLCRQQRLLDRQRAADVALSRLGHQGPQRRHAVRPVHDRAARRRPAAQSDQEPARRHGLPPQHADQRRRRHRPGAVPPRSRRRSREHHRRGLARPDRRLLPVPHAQVRPDPAPRVLRAVRLLQQRHRHQQQGRDAFSVTRGEMFGRPSRRRRQPTPDPAELAKQQAAWEKRELARLEKLDAQQDAATAQWSPAKYVEYDTEVRRRLSSCWTTTRCSPTAAAPTTTPTASSSRPTSSRSPPSACACSRIRRCPAAAPAGRATATSSSPISRSTVGGKELPIQLGLCRSRAAELSGARPRSTTIPRPAGRSTSARPDGQAERRSRGGFHAGEAACRSTPASRWKSSCSTTLNENYLVGRFAIDLSDKPPAKPVAVDEPLLAALRIAAEKRTAEQAKAVAEAFARSDAMAEPPRPAAATARSPTRSS